MACNARARARDSMRIGIQLRKEISHFERRDRRVPTLVAMRATGAGDRLLGIVAGQHPEPDGTLEIDARLRQSPRRLTGNVVEVRRVAPNHGTDGHESVIPL